MRLPGDSVRVLKHRLRLFQRDSLCLLPGPMRLPADSARVLREPLRLISRDSLCLLPGPLRLPADSVRVLRDRLCIRLDAPRLSLGIACLARRPLHWQATRMCAIPVEGCPGTALRGAESASMAGWSHSRFSIRPLPSHRMGHAFRASASLRPLRRFPTPSSGVGRLFMFHLNAAARFRPLANRLSVIVFTFAQSVFLRRSRPSQNPVSLAAHSSRH
jgi:hypothetical protein